MVDMKKMRRGYESQQRGGEFFNIPEGDTITYIHPPCRGEADEFEPTEGLNYIPVTVHYGIGKKNSMAVCLDNENNPIISHPFIKAFLKKRKISLDGVCPVCNDIEKGKMDADEMDRSRAQTRYLWGHTPIEQRGRPSEDWRKLASKPSPSFFSKTVYDGLMEVFFDNGDITDPVSAVFVKLHREGTGMTDTRYKVTADARTIKKPKKLPKQFRIMLKKAMKEGGDCDLFKIVAHLIRSSSEVKALLAGVSVEEGPNLDEMDEEEDDEAILDEDGDEEPEEDEEEEEPEEEPEEEEPEEEEEEEEEEEPEEEEEEKEEDEEPEDSDLGLDELDAELEAISKGKSAKKPAKKTVKKSSKKKS